MSRSRRRKLARARMECKRLPANRALLPLASAVLMSVGMAAPTLQAAAAVAAASDTADTGTLEEVVVTAQKRTEDLQKVPITLTVLSNEKLAEHQVQNFDDYAKLLPNVSYQSLGPGQAQMYFRGITSGQDGLHAGSLPGTGLYLDEIPVTTIGNSLDIHAYDMERVEALAGPQGTLYGASSLSGTMRVITNKPDPTKFEAGYDLTGDKYGRGNGGEIGEGFVNIPLTETMAIRLVGYYDHEGGYINNVPTSNTILYGYGGDTPANPNYGSYFGPTGAPLATTWNNDTALKQRANPVDTYGGRAALKVNLNDNWTLLPQLITQSQQAKGDFEYNPKLGDLNVDDYTLGNNSDQWYQSALTVQGKIADFELTYVGGWFERKVDNTVDYSGYTIGYDAKAQSPAATYNSNGIFVDPTTGKPLNPMQYVANHDHYTKMSHELRLSSPTDYRISGTVGLFYQRQTDRIRAEYRGFDNDLPAANSVDGQPGIVYLGQYQRADRDYAAFTELTGKITPDLKLTGGIRKFYVENTLFGFFGFPYSTLGEGSCNPPVSAATIIPNYLPCVNANKKVIENGETHKLSLSYQIDPQAMVYTTYSTGFRPGGNNRVPGVAPYGSDTLTNIEGGWKTTWLGSTLRWNGALYFERWKGVQYALTGQFGITSIVNAGNAAVKGIDTDLDWLPIESLELNFAGTYLNARLTDNFCNADPVTEAITHSCNVAADVAANAGSLDFINEAPKGTPLPVQPPLKANVSARYKFNVVDYKSFFQVALFHQSSSRSDLRVEQNAAEGNLPHFTTVDLSLGAGKDNWNIQAFINNAFDERGALGRTAACATSNCYYNYREYPIKPQFFGIKFGQKF
jgi:iron complex outermembrane receptor protein